MAGFLDFHANDEPMWGTVGSELNKLFPNQGWSPDFSELGFWGGKAAILPALEQAMAAQNERARQQSAERIAAMNSGSQFDSGLMSALGHLLTNQTSMRNADMDRMLRAEDMRRRGEQFGIEEQGKDRRSSDKLRSNMEISRMIQGNKSMNMPAPPSMKLEEKMMKSAPVFKFMKEEWARAGKQGAEPTMNDAMRAVEAKATQDHYNNIAKFRTQSQQEAVLPTLLANTATSPERISPDEMPVEALPSLSLSAQAQPTGWGRPAQAGVQPPAVLPTMDTGPSMQTARNVRGQDLRGNPLNPGGRLEEVQYTGTPGMNQGPPINREVRNDYEQYGYDPTGQMAWASKPVSQRLAEMEDADLTKSLYNQAARESRRQRMLENDMKAMDWQFSKPKLSFDEFDSPATTPPPGYQGEIDRRVNPSSYKWSGAIGPDDASFIGEDLKAIPQAIRRMTGMDNQAQQESTQPVDEVLRAPTSYEANKSWYDLIPGHQVYDRARSGEYSRGKESPILDLLPFLIPALRGTSLVASAGSNLAKTGAKDVARQGTKILDNYMGKRAYGRYADQGSGVMFAPGENELGGGASRLLNSSGLQARDISEFLKWLFTRRLQGGQTPTIGQ